MSTTNKQIFHNLYQSSTKARCRRKEDFELYVELFRPLNEEEEKSILRSIHKVEIYIAEAEYSSFLVSYQAQTGGFTICNIILYDRTDTRLYTGSSHCIKSDRWLPIRGKMLAFRRALESEGIELPKNKEGEKNG